MVKEKEKIMAKRNMPKMAKAENFETKVETKVAADEAVEETTVDIASDEVVEAVEETTDEVESEEDQETKTAKPKFVTVDIDKQLRLRAASSTSADVLTLLNPGTKCEVIDGNSEWLKVKVDGKIGYVMSKFVK